MFFGTASGYFATAATTTCFLWAATQGRERTRQSSAFITAACPPFSPQLPLVAKRGMRLRRSPWVSGAPDRAGSIIGMGLFAVRLQRLAGLKTRLGPRVLHGLHEVGYGWLAVSCSV